MEATPIGPWERLEDGRTWRRRLDGEEVFMTWQEVHKKGFMVLTAAFAYTVQGVNFQDFARRIKHGWIKARFDIPMLACRFVGDINGDHQFVQYTVPSSEQDICEWADLTVQVKAKDTYDWSVESDGHPDRPDNHVAMLRVLEQGGHLIDGTIDGSAHLVMFTVSHAMADIYTLCDVGRLMLEALGKPEETSKTWGKELCALPTSISTAYRHFIGQPSAQDSKISARYWGASFLPLLKKQYCALPLNASDHPATPHHILHQMGEEESTALIAYAKIHKVSVTALTYGALAYEIECISNLNGSEHCVGIVRNNRRFFPVPLKHEHAGSPAPAGTMTLLSLPLSDTKQTAIDRILQLARAFSAAIRPHTDGSAAQLGLANIDALVRPYMAMQQHKTATLLSWLPRIWSTSTLFSVLRTSATRPKSDATKPPPLAFSAHGNLDEVLPSRAGDASLCGYHLFTRPGDDTLAVLTYTFRARFHLRIVHNARYYDKDVVDLFAKHAVDHLRSLL